MLCEVEFLAVGEASRAGDCIVLRYGAANDYKVMVVDGGTAETGETLVEHLKTQFGDGVTVEHVLLTHSDSDHASGLRELLREIPVTNIWLHIPWIHAQEAIDCSLFKDRRWTKEGLEKKIKEEYDIIAEIVELAIEKGCNVYEPYAGNKIGPFTVLSPDQHCYLHLLPQFDKTPDPDQETLEGKNFWLGKQPSGLMTLFEKAVAKIQNWVKETWENERLQDGGITSASNESSVVLYGSFDKGRVLLTGDAGVNALTWAADHADSAGLPLQSFAFVQIPHHGSRRNVGPTILNRLLGPILPKGSDSTFSAFASVPKDDEKHPRKIVLNAFMRRGGDVILTQGVKKVHWGGFPYRAGYSAAASAEFSYDVEDYD
jgi:beta-lactamase superfamily II metal-dependent hydrolase